MRNFIKTLFSAILAGILISIGGTIFLTTKNISVIMGGFLFAFGLFIIITLKLNLFTGKIGYVLCNKSNYVIDLLIILFGNAIGAILMGYLLRFMCLNSSLAIQQIVNNVAENKLSLPLHTSFILSILCGMLIFIAVEVSKREVSSLVKVLAIFLSVAIFVIAGFEHCIANMFYFSFANAWSIKAVYYLIIMILGNSLGSIIIYLILRLAEGKKVKE